MSRNDLIAKSFPKGYILHSFGALVPFSAPAAGWYIVKHHGKNGDLEIFEVMGAKRPWPTKQEAILELRRVRG